MDFEKNAFCILFHSSEKLWDLTEPRKNYNGRCFIRLYINFHETLKFFIPWSSANQVLDFDFINNLKLIFQKICFFLHKKSFANGMKVIW